MLFLAEPLGVSPDGDLEAGLIQMQGMEDLSDWASVERAQALPLGTWDSGLLGFLKHL